MTHIKMINYVQSELLSYILQLISNFRTYGLNLGTRILSLRVYGVNKPNMLAFFS